MARSRSLDFVVLGLLIERPAHGYALKRALTPALPRNQLVNDGILYPLLDRLERDELVRRVSHPSDARTTLAVITGRGRRLAEAATRDLNETVYARIGLAEAQRTQLTDLLAELRANGNEFDVARSGEVIDGLTARHQVGRAR